MDMDVQATMIGRMEKNTCVLCGKDIPERRVHKLANHNILGPVKVCHHHPTGEESCERRVETRTDVDHQKS